MVRTRLGSNAHDFVGGDAGSYAAATDYYAPFYLSLRHRFGHRNDKIRIVVFSVECGSPKVHHLLS
jgi:hypothetical protein